ncbi:MAG: DUF4838 domain-containing protein [Victivallales bacterium]|nr:DUF4838 domain-containing protein [Victivallales bacterium]
MMRIWVLGIFLHALACLPFEADIVLPEIPEPWELQAAANLRKYLRESLDKGVFIDGNPVKFHVGKTALTQVQGWRLEEEEWRIKSIGGQLVLYGGGRRGTLYAVSIFLERFVGVHFFCRQEVGLAPAYELKLPHLDLTGKPFFPLRSIYPASTEKPDQGDFAVFNRLNCFGEQRISAENGGAFLYGSPYHVHTFSKYISRKEFFHTHPEYFSLNAQGTRDPSPSTGQLCLSNPALVEIFWNELQGYILKDEANALQNGLPPPQIYDISQNDNNAFCHCQACQEHRRFYGDAEAGLQLNLVNQLARRLKDFRPGLKLSTLAYYQTEKIPRNIVLEDNILVRLCNTSNNYAGAPTGYGEEPFRHRVEEWGKKAASLGVWDYGISFNSYARGLPYPSEFFLQDTMRYYRDHQVRYPFVEREYIYHSDMHVMKTWLHAKLMEDPDADFSSLMRTFLGHYYGEAAPFILKYRTELLASVERHRPYITAFMPAAIAFTHLDCNTVETCDDLLEQAELSVQHNSTLLRRVREARAGIDEAIVLFIRKFNLEAPGHHLDVQTASRRLKDTIRQAIQLHVAPKCQAACLRQEEKKAIHLFLPERIPPQREVPGGLDIPIELASWWAGGQPLVKDVDSHVGYAVKVSQGEMPVLMGGYDQQTRSEHFSARLTAEEIHGGGYHWYVIGKSFAPRPAGYIYLTSKWYVQFPQSLAYAVGPHSPWRIHVSMKFTGPAYPGGNAQDDNAIWIDRIVLEKMDKVIHH